jgi:hypothetical protein
VKRLAADGPRAAYATCDRVSVWTAGTGASIDGPAAGCSSVAYPLPVTTLALAGNRLAYGTIGGGNGTVWWLGGMTVEPTLQSFVLASGTNTCCLPQPEVAGSGNLLVFDSRAIVRYDPYPPHVEWQIRAAGQAGCGCPIIKSFVQPFDVPVSLDADAGRILIARSRSLELLDAGGTTVLFLPDLPTDPASNPSWVVPIESVLSGSDIIVRVADELRDYDADNGGLLHSWRLPAVPILSSPDERILQAAARGLVAYVLAGRVHILRLSDGADAAIASGSLAQFMDSGLVYADGARIHLIPFAKLPSRSSVR